MKKFMGEDFLLENETAKHLYEDYAKNMPIYDYHCHLSPKEIAEDKKYENITEIWLYGDHYKWRFMRSMGVDEKYCTGDASDYEKFLAYAKCVAYAAGNPLYHWTHLELQRFFGIYEPLNEKTAPEIWKKANEIIKSGDFSAQKLIEKSNVYLIGTTDDPVDSLEYHEKLKDFSVKVVPAFRPDKAANVEKSDFADYIKLLEKASGVKIEKFADLEKAISSRMDHFAKMGSKISDHAVSFVPFKKASDAELDEILAKAINGGEVSADDEEKYKTAFLIFCAREYAKRGWVLQLHIVVKRGLACISMIFTPVRCQVVVAVNQFAAFKVISHIIHAVVVETVRAHYLVAVRHDHVFAHLGHLGAAVVVQFVTFKCERVALHDAYPSESVKRL